VNRYATAAAVTAGALLATWGTASAHVPTCEGDTVVNVNPADPPISSVSDNGDGTIHVVWEDGFEGDFPALDCTFTTDTTTTTTTSSSLPAATSTTVTPSVDTTAEPGTTAPTSSTLPAASAPSGPTTSVASSVRLPETGVGDDLAVIGAALAGVGVTLIGLTWWTRRRSDG
jgi:heme-binding NEAT domain protein